jgi:hypothetical protein
MVASESAFHGDPARREHSAYGNHGIHGAEDVLGQWSSGESRRTLPRVPTGSQKGTPPAHGRFRLFEESAMSQRNNKSPRKPLLKEENNEEPSDVRNDKPLTSPIQPRAYPDPIDDTLDDSFPASDPPSWAGR